MLKTEGPESFHFPHFLPETPQELPKLQFQALKVATIIPIRSSMGAPPRGFEDEGSPHTLHAKMFDLLNYIQCNTILVLDFGC